jgi:hypothetical protein
VGRQNVNLFALEALEPRVLLSSDGAGTAATIAVAGHDAQGAAIEVKIPQMVDAALTYDPSQIVNGIFEGIPEAAVGTNPDLQAKNPADEKDSSAKESGEDLRMVSDSIAPLLSAPGNDPAGTTPGKNSAMEMIEKTAAENDSTQPEQMVETLRAANGPPATLPESPDNLIQGTYLASSGSQSTNQDRTDVAQPHLVLEPASAPGPLDFAPSASWASGTQAAAEKLHLLFGNPTNATVVPNAALNPRQTNYELIRPDEDNDGRSEYIVSYNNVTHDPNWAAWQLDDT